MNFLTFILSLKHAMQTQRRRSLHMEKTHDQHLEACCRGFSAMSIAGQTSHRLPVFTSHAIFETRTLSKQEHSVAMQWLRHGMTCHSAQGQY